MFPRALSAVVLLLASPLLAQAPAATTASQASGNPTTLKLSTRIVILDVVVTDRRGRILTRDLTRDDFTVFEDKDQQTIRNFDAPSGHAMPDNVIVHSTADLQKIGNAPVTVLVLDALNTSFDNFSFVRQSMVKYLNTQPPLLRQPTALLISTDTRFKLMADYTQDRDALIARIKAEPPGYPSKFMAGRGGPAAVERMAQTLGSIEQIAQASIGTPGKKNVIWVGGGFPTADLSGLDDNTAATIQAAVRQCTDMLMAARITMFTIDPTPNGTTSVEVTTPEEATIGEVENGREPFDGTIAFPTLALATGGSAFASRNDIYREIAQSVAAGDNFYTLTYVPTGGSLEEAKYRKIRIVMRDPNLIATTRNGYYPLTEKTDNIAVAEPPRQANAQLRLEISNAVNSALSYNGLEIKATRSGERYILNVEGAGLSWTPLDAHKQKTEATVIAAWYSDKGKLLGHTNRELVATRAIPSDPANPGEAAFSIAVSPPADAARLRFVVRDAANARIGTVDLKP